MIKLSSIFPDITLNYLFEDYEVSRQLEIKNGEVLNQNKEVI
jgi:hypothetical protein